jgi:hypothetical protein
MLRLVAERAANAPQQHESLAPARREGTGKIQDAESCLSPYRASTPCHCPLPLQDGPGPGVLTFSARRKASRATARGDLVIVRVIMAQD